MSDRSGLPKRVVIGESEVEDGGQRAGLKRTGGVDGVDVSISCCYGRNWLKNLKCIVVDIISPSSVNVGFPVVIRPHEGCKIINGRWTYSEMGSGQSHIGGNRRKCEILYKGSADPHR